MQQRMWAWHALTHLIAVIGLVYLVLGQHWLLLALTPVFIFFSGMAVNVGLHRYISHKSFRTGPLRDVFIKYWTLFTGLGSPVMWGIAHRYHHAHSDTEKDFQNPRVIGSLRSWFTIYPQTNFGTKYATDIIKCPHNRFIHRHYFKLQFAVMALMFYINPLLVPVVLAIPFVACFHGAAAIGVLTHGSGYRVLATNDNSTNNILAAVLSLGEGWHNYHHGRPGDYRHGHQWWELDPPAWIIERFFKIQ